MLGFFSLFAKLFKGQTPVPAAPTAPTSRLLNPSAADSSDPQPTPASLIQLEDHLFCWLLDTAPYAFTTAPDPSDPALVELWERLDASELEELPRQPLTLPMLLRALSDESTSRTKLTAIILEDPALTDQLLQVANSPMFRPHDQTIESVDSAVFLLGIDGIRGVISAAVMRPMLAARNSREAMFAQRVWRWGLACARAAEQIARTHGQDPSAFFLVGLLPALSYLTLYRELWRIFRSQGRSEEPPAALVRLVMSRYQWLVCQILANEWNLPPKYHAYLLAAERPAPRGQNTPLNDGIIIGTREVLRHARQRNLSEDDLLALVRLSTEQFQRVREGVLRMLREGNRPENPSG